MTIKELEERSGASDRQRQKPPLSEQGDEIWEHKKGKIWLLVKKLEQKNRELRLQNRILKERVALEARLRDRRRA